MIEFKNVCFSYGEPLIENLSFKVNDGENLFIYGPSGCGKTTVARLILKLNTPQSGTVTAPPIISAVFQEDRLVDRISVFSNICLPLKKEQYEYAQKLIEEFGLKDVVKKPVWELSGGTKRRIAIIRAIAFGGDALLLDEPFNGIDRDNILLVSKIINREYTDNGKSVILISHNKDDAELFGAKTLLISK